LVVSLLRKSSKIFNLSRVPRAGLEPARRITYEGF
jgi:hypothetical protein